MRAALDHDLAGPVVARVTPAFVPAAIAVEHDLLHVAMAPAFMAGTLAVTDHDLLLHHAVLAGSYLHFDRRVLGECRRAERRRGKRHGNCGGRRKSKHSHSPPLGPERAAFPAIGGSTRGTASRSHQRGLSSCFV